MKLLSPLSRRVILAHGDVCGRERTALWRKIENKLIFTVFFYVFYYKLYYKFIFKIQIMKQIFCQYFCYNVLWLAYSWVFVYVFFVVG